MNEIFYCSKESAREELPVSCWIERYLFIKGMKNKAATLRTTYPIHRVQASAFVVVAKGIQTIDEVFEERLMGVYLMVLDQRAGRTELDLSAGLRSVLDWGALTVSKLRAEKWQVR